MNVAEIGVVFVLFWWMIFFVTLPFGISRAVDPGPGGDHGAPERTRLWVKAGITTSAATIITVVIYVAADAGLLPLREWLTPEAFDPSTR